MVTKEEFQEWKQSPVTKAVLAGVAEKRQGIMESWAAGQVRGDFESGVQAGRCQMAEDLLKIEHDEGATRGVA